MEAWMALSGDERAAFRATIDVNSWLYDLRYDDSIMGPEWYKVFRKLS
jgi:hypothetical protein